MNPNTTLTFALTLLLAGGATGVAQYMPGNVVQPGDRIIASSGNSPGSEGVANAIDGTQSKYLNFDTSNGKGLLPSGFIVTPSVGSTWLSGIAIQTANDAPERDPKHFTIEGSNDDPAALTNWTSGTWTTIIDMTIPNIATRYAWQTFYFTNYAAFRNYRWTVIQTATANDCCMQVAEVQLLGASLPKNVLVPSDRIVASSGNSPGSEGVANAIDGTQSKYLNFDTSNGKGLLPSGFAVTPSLGDTLINGISIQSANDAPERDPLSFTIEGSNDDTLTNFTSGNWEMVYSTTSFPVSATRYAWQTVVFPNLKAYKHYRWTVLQTATANDCCMQVAEVQLLGSGAPQNILVPSDRIVASSGNSPGSEGVANAIDGTQSKYLNFDTSNGKGLLPSGFAVTPSVGETLVMAMRIQTANDAPERDPKHVTIEGSNDETLTNFTSGNWTLIADLQVPTVATRYAWQTVTFPNLMPFKHYRWTVLQTVTANDCCMQVAEVQLLAVTAKADCGKAAFVLRPEDTPVLQGSQATFFVAVNGPWPLQWFTNGVAVPGATKTSYITDPITAANEAINYAVAIVGCQTSAPVAAVIFKPSTIPSIGVNLGGGGANGAPTYMNPDDIAGVQQQAFWLNVTNTGGGTITGLTGDGVTLPDSLVDSSNNVSTITFDYATSGSWGSGVGVDTPTQRLLNGLQGATGPAAAGSDPPKLAFHNVPPGNHAVLVYAVSPPLQIQTVSYNVGSKTYYARVMNSDEYKKAPGFYRASSTNASSPDIANFIRFDNVQPDVLGDITLTYNVLTPASGTTRQTGVNAIQLVLNAPNPGEPPLITQQPQYTVGPSNGFVTLTVQASGTGLTYQWRRNGAVLQNGGNISGADSATLMIYPFTAADEGIYSVAVFSPAGSAISRNAALSISKYDINDALAGYWNFDAGSGLIVSNSLSGGQPIGITTATGNPVWGAGQVNGSFNFDLFTYGLVTDYPKATRQVAGSVWIKIPSGNVGDMAIVHNAAPEITTSGGAGTVKGQISLDLIQDGALDYYPQARVGLGPNMVQADSPTKLTTDTWHHLAFTADGAQLRLYIDNVLVDAEDYLGDINPADIPWLSVGQALITDTNTPPAIPDPASPDQFLGNMDELAIWARALTAEEIALLYEAGRNHNPLTSVTISPPAVIPTLGVTSNADGTFTLTYTGTLVAADTVNGAYAPVVGAVSPYTVNPKAAGAKPAQFFRAQQ